MDFERVRISTTLSILLLSLQTVEEGFALNPGCTCLRYTSTYGKDRGTFSSPDYPKPYSTGISCLLYTFIAGPQQIVEISFNDFDVYKGHLDCLQDDFLKVYSEAIDHGPGPPGINEFSPWTSVLCGGRSDAPKTLYSQGSLLVLMFHSGSKAVNSTGFIGTYKFIDRKTFETDGVHVPNTWCDYVFRPKEGRMDGRFYSPRYPSPYPNNVQCSYHFHARSNERVRILFDEIFLEKGDDSCLNKADVIKVFDGRYSTMPVLALLCNEIIGYEVLSTTSDILIQFTSKSRHPGQGFKALFQFQVENRNNSDSNSPDSDAQLAEKKTKLCTSSSCWEYYSSDKSKSGHFTSPLYPNPFSEKTLCHYNFIARGKERVQIVFRDFLLRKMNGATDCEATDSLGIFLYVDGKLEKMSSICGSEIPKSIMSNGPRLSMEFRGVFSSRLSRGFNISFNFVQDYGIKTGKQLLDFPCAFVYNSSGVSKGFLTSPNYPGLYPRDTECHYFFYGNEKERVHLSFSHFDVEGVAPCTAQSASDYIQFSNQLIGGQSSRFCGQLKDLHISSEGNFLRLTFKSNSRLDAIGFKAEYEFVESETRFVVSSIESDSIRIKINNKYIAFVLYSLIIILTR